MPQYNDVPSTPPPSKQRDIFFVDVYFGGKSLRMVTFGPLSNAGGRTLLAGWLRTAIAICINRTLTRALAPPPTQSQCPVGVGRWVFESELCELQVIRRSGDLIVGKYFDARLPWLCTTNGWQTALSQLDRMVPTGRGRRFALSP